MAFAGALFAVVADVFLAGALAAFLDGAGFAAGVFAAEDFAGDVFEAPVAFVTAAVAFFFPESTNALTFVSLPIPVALVPASTAPSRSDRCSG